MEQLSEILKFYGGVGGGGPMKQLSENPQR